MIYEHTNIMARYLAETAGAFFAIYRSVVPGHSERYYYFSGVTIMSRFFVVVRSNQRFDSPRPTEALVNLMVS